MTTSPSLSLQDVNLSDPRNFVPELPHPAWTLLRREAPIHWELPWLYSSGQQLPGFWDITRYQDIVRISRDPQTFISGKGITASDDPEVDDPLSGRGTMMITSDPPRHVRLRRLVNKGFTPRQVAALEPHVRAIVTSILDELVDRRQCDFVVDISAKLPLAVICEMVGVKREDWNYMFELTNRTLGAADEEYQTEATPYETVMKAQLEMFQYFAKGVVERRAEPHDDLLATLVTGEIDGDKLTDEEILFFCFLLIVAGNETTRNATTGGVLALQQNPEQWQMLRDNPSLLPTAIEEVLRWTSPVLHMSRVATRDVELRGQMIKAGQKVVMWYPSANRDEDIFPEPFRFDIQRTPNEHLAFGIGEHFCLGASLARLELRVAFEVLLRRMPDLQLAGDAERLRSNFIGGIKHLPVCW